MVAGDAGGKDDTSLDFTPEEVKRMERIARGAFLDAGDQGLNVRQPKPEEEVPPFDPNKKFVTIEKNPVLHRKQPKDSPRI
jgi:hypothetical protein